MVITFSNLRFPSTRGIGLCSAVNDTASQAASGGGAVVRAPDAGVAVAGNALFRSPALMDPTSLTDPRAATTQMVNNLYALLSRFQPTEETPETITFDAIGLIDGQVLQIAIHRNSATGTIRDLIVRTRAIFVSVALPPNDDALLAPGSIKFGLLLQVCQTLQQRLVALNEDDEWLMRSEWAETRNKKDQIAVPHSALQPAYHTALTDRLADIETRAAAIPPQRYVPYADFVQLVAQLVLKDHPEKTRVTGAETTWAELESHGGLYNSNFATTYAPINHEGATVIDLLTIARRKKDYPVDHGYDPIRNGFHLYADERDYDGAARLMIAGGSDIRPNERNVGQFLDLYEVAIAAGYPVIISALVADAARGVQTEPMYRDDPRLKGTAYQFTEATVPTSLPLPADAPGSLPPLA